MFCLVSLSQITRLPCNCHWNTQHAYFSTTRNAIDFTMITYSIVQRDQFATKACMVSHIISLYVACKSPGRQLRVAALELMNDWYISNLVSRSRRRVNRRRSSRNIRRLQRHIRVRMRRVRRTRRGEVARDLLFSRCDIPMVQSTVEVSQCSLGYLMHPLA
jgi:hypothetical protein